MKKFAVLGLVALALGIAAYGVNAQEGKKMSIKDVMKKFPALAKKINKGEGSDAEKKEFVELAKALAANTPKKGDAMESVSYLPPAVWSQRAAASATGSKDVTPPTNNSSGVATKADMLAALDLA